jgi:hypothetical protein
MAIRKAKYRPAITKAIWTLELFRMFPDSEIAALLKLKRSSASALVHNRKPRRVSR